MAGSTSIKARIATIEAQLEAMTAATLGGMPTTSGGGESIDHIRYRESLLRELEQLRKMLPMADGPWELKG
jgi:hypothetical protein